MIIIIMANNYYILSIFYHARQCARLCMVIIVLDSHSVLGGNIIPLGLRACG